MYFSNGDRVLIQGIEQPLARYYVPRLKASGTAIVAGLSVGSGGDSLQDIPIFDLVEEAVAKTGKIDTSLLFVPSYRVLDAALEAIDAGIRQLMIITPDVPPLDTIELLKVASARQVLILGPGSQGVIVPGKLWLGTREPDFYRGGTVGLLTRGDRSGDEVARALSGAGLGQSMAIDLGTDGIIGSGIEQWLQVLEEDEDTEAIVLVSQIGDRSEMEAARYISESIEKPTIVYLAGLSCPIDYRFGDTDTIISGQLSYSTALTGSRREIIRHFQNFQIKYTTRLENLADLVMEAITAVRD